MKRINDEFEEKNQYDRDVVAVDTIVVATALVVRTACHIGKHSGDARCSGVFSLVLTCVCSDYGEF